MISKKLASAGLILLFITLIVTVISLGIYGGLNNTLLELIVLTVIAIIISLIALKGISKSKATIILYVISAIISFYILHVVTIIAGILFLIAAYSTYDELKKEED